MPSPNHSPNTTSKGGKLTLNKVTLVQLNSTHLDAAHGGTSPATALTIATTINFAAGAIAITAVAVSVAYGCFTRIAEGISPDLDRPVPPGPPTPQCPAPLPGLPGPSEVKMMCIVESMGLPDRNRCIPYKDPLQGGY